LQSLVYTAVLYCVIILYVPGVNKVLANVVVASHFEITSFFSFSFDMKVLVVSAADNYR